ncbi:MAG TPA: hypothetical protein PLB63_01415 [Planctomycetota bacterium]|nr:hypothetical protein [Planctomycetota bacterium]
MNTKKFALGRQSCSGEARLLWGREARLLREGKVAPGKQMLLWGRKLLGGGDVALGRKVALGKQMLLWGSRCCSGEGKLLWGENLLGGRKVARGRHKMRE